MCRSWVEPPHLSALLHPRQNLAAAAAARRGRRRRRSLGQRQRRAGGGARGSGPGRPTSVCGWGSAPPPGSPRQRGSRRPGRARRARQRREGLRSQGPAAAAMPQVRVDVGADGRPVRKRKAKVEPGSPCPKKQSGAPAPGTPEEGVQVQAVEKEQQQRRQVADAFMADLYANPVKIHKILNDERPADEDEWATLGYSKKLAGMHVTMRKRGGVWKDIADRLLVWWVVEEEQAEFGDSQEMLHQYLNSLSSSEAVEDQAKFHLIAHNHLALYQDLEIRGRWKAIATSKADFTNLRELVDRVKDKWSEPNDVFEYLKYLQEGDDVGKYPVQEGDLGLINRNTPAFYVLIEEACGDGLWKDLKYMAKQWTLGGVGRQEVWGPLYGVCRHVGWDFRDLCHCGVPSSIRIRGEQSKERGRSTSPAT